MPSVGMTLSVLERPRGRFQGWLGVPSWPGYGLGQPVIGCEDLPTGAACSIDNGSVPIRPSRERVPHGRA